MDSAQMIDAVLAEMQRIPAERLPELYRLVHDFRLQVEPISSKPDSMRFAGCWSDFSEEAYAELMTDLATRRQQAFAERRAHEANLD